ncbi:MAG: S1 RNA-binding domain-containing protein [Alphaproteobacteria bacterium]|nr:S1 RNA-binding domain-containing protein [Alphaproteobacteria bacterium]
MSGYELFADDIDGRMHAAVVRKGVVTDLYVDPIDMTGAWAALYLGKVIKLDKKLDAAIVDLGNGLSGFLPAKHVRFPGEGPAETRTGIADLLKPGQMVTVQIKSEAKNESLHEQHKLPRLTTKIYVMGQHLLYSPVLNSVTISRSIQNEKIIGMTARLKGKGGWLVQSTAEKADAATLEAESRQLMHEWQIIHDAREASEDKPRLLKGAPSALYRALGDYGSNRFDHIHIGNRRIFERMEKWCKRLQPDLATSKRLRLFKPEKPEQRLFEIDDIYSTLQALDNDIVHLPCGGSIIIEPTHAMVIIDVNQGGAASQMIANMEAAAESARQIRLRNLSGAILIDFINMQLKSDRYQLYNAVEKAFARDHANAAIYGFTRLGIMEITRKRRSSPLAERLKR